MITYHLCKLRTGEGQECYPVAHLKHSKTFATVRVIELRKSCNRCQIIYVFIDNVSGIGVQN